MSTPKMIFFLFLFDPKVIEIMTLNDCAIFSLTRNAARGARRPLHVNIFFHFFEEKNAPAFADAFSYEVRNNNTHEAEAYTSEIFCLNSARALRILTLAAASIAILRFEPRNRRRKSVVSRVMFSLTIRF